MLGMTGGDGQEYIGCSGRTSLDHEAASSLDTGG